MKLSRAAFLRSLAAGLAGLVGYGVWAYIANMSHGEEAAMRAALVQGSYSLVLTFVMTLVTEFLYQQLGSVAGGLYLTTAVVGGILFASAYSIHVLAGTPEILMTIFPGFAIGTIYTYVYLLGLRKLSAS